MVCWVPPHLRAGFLRGTLVEVLGAALRRSGQTPAHWGHVYVQSVSVGMSVLGSLGPMRAVLAMTIISIFSSSSLGMGEIIWH